MQVNRQLCYQQGHQVSRRIGFDTTSPIIRLMQTNLMMAFVITLAMTSTMLIITANVHAKVINNPNNTPFELSISRGARESVDNGVALTFEVSYAQPKKILFWTVHLSPEKHAFVLQRHALSNRYIVLDHDNETHIFPSIQASLDFIANQSLDILKSYHSNGQKVAMQSRINTFKLPSPIRLKAFLSNDWDIDETWYSWTSAL